jgi:cob(I)alamin adenosyltransferase
MICSSHQPTSLLLASNKVDDAIAALSQAMKHLSQTNYEGCTNDMVEIRNQLDDLGWLAADLRTRSFEAIP